MMRQIRPYRMFTLLPELPAERIANVAIPGRRGAGGTSLLESFLIIAGIRIVDAKRIFEFGTFRGSNTFNMALNTPNDACIFTIDLDELSATDASQLPEDAYLTKLHLQSESSLDFSGSLIEHKIKCLVGNSTTFDYSPWRRSIDLSFIDGGHDFNTAKSDTKNAFEMAAIERASCILWHDYRNNEYPDLTRYLDDLAMARDIFHIADTSLCIWLNDPGQSILSRLMQ